MKILLLITSFFITAGIYAQKPAKQASGSDKPIIHEPYIDSQITRSVNYINACRKAAGLDTLFLSALQSSRCDKHARYLVLNKNSPEIAGLKAHHEKEGLPGYSKDGAIAAWQSDIFQGTQPFAAAEGFFNSFYHRIPLLQPNLRSIGIGYYSGEDYNSATVLDCLSGAQGTPDKDVVFYPGENQKNLPLTFQDEIPSPLKSISTEGGYPVTIYFTKNQKIDSVRFKLSDKFHNNIPCELSTPENPATSFPQWNTICAIPEKHLKSAHEYSVSLSCNVNGKSFSKEYSFTTFDNTSNLYPNIYLSPLSDFSSEWNDKKYESCNTALSTLYMMDNEQKVIWILNLARMNPKLFVETVLNEYAGRTVHEAMKSSTYFASLVEMMNEMEPAGILKPDSLCYVSALCHATISGSLGYEGHVRVKADCQRKQHFMGECCDYGNGEALDIVIALLVDEDVPGFGHRLICLDKTYSKLGVSIQPHKKYRHTAVLDFY